MVDFYLPRVDPQSTTDTLRGAGAEAFGAGIGDALQRTGERLGAIEERRKRAEEELDEQYQATEAGKALAQLGADVDAETVAAQESMAPGGAGHTERLIESFDKRQEALLAGITNAKVRDRATVQLAQMRARVASQESAVEAGARVRKTKLDVGDMIAIGANRIRGKADVAVFGETLDQFDTMVGGLKLPDEAKRDLRAEGYNRFARSLVEGLRPEEAKKVLTDGTLDQYLKPETLDALLSENGVALRQAEYERKSAAALAKAEAVQRINLAQKILADGGVLPKEQMEELAGLAKTYSLDHETYDLGKAGLVNDLNRVHRSSTPPQIDARIKQVDAAIAKAGDTVDPALTIERGHLASLLSARRTELSTDPLGYAARNGVAIDPIEWDDPNSVARRLRQARAVSQATGAPLKPLTDEEAADLTTLAASGAAGRLDAINRVASFGPGGAMAVARLVAPNDLVFARAATLPPAYRPLVVRGIEARKLVKIPDDEARQAYQDKAALALRHLGGDFAVATRETAANIYAEQMRSRGAGGETPFDERQYDVAVHLALGGDTQGGVRRGGIGEWREAAMLLPTRMTQAEFDQRMTRLSAKMPAGAVNGSPVWKDGSPVMSGDIRERFTPVAVRDGVYRFERGGTVLVTRKGDPWLLDIRKVGE